MMIRSLCNSCFQTYELRIDSSEIHLLKQISDENGHTCPCPRLCGGRINLVGDPSISETHNLNLRDPLPLSGRELYKAVHGAGLPDEIPVDKDVVAALLKSGSIRRVELEEDSGRIFVHELEMHDGIVLHLSSGNRGAHILKITKRGK